MATQIPGMRAQILANAKIMLKTTSKADPKHGSQATLIPHNYGDMDVVVFGTKDSLCAAVMVGLVPAIEGDRAPTPEGALHKLFSATCELLNSYIPKVGDHQRSIHGGGVFDEDMISPEIVEMQRRCS